MVDDFKTSQRPPKKVSEARRFGWMIRLIGSVARPRHLDQGHMDKVIQCNQGDPEPQRVQTILRGTLSLCLQYGTLQA